MGKAVKVYRIRLYRLYRNNGWSESQLLCVVRSKFDIFVFSLSITGTDCKNVVLLVLVVFRTYIVSGYVLVCEYKYLNSTHLRQFSNIRVISYCSALFELRVFRGVRVTRTLVLCVYFVDRCLSFCTFSFGHCVVCFYSIYGFWLPLWYLQTLLPELRLLNPIFMHLKLLYWIWSGFRKDNNGRRSH